jgi:3-oxoadipate enol-lactonase
MTVVLLGGLGTTTRIWQQQLDVLDDALPLDLPGHGVAPPPAGAMSIEAIAADVLDRAPSRFTFVGLSLGGMVGMWLGANAPDRVERLVLACTGAKLGRKEEYEARADLVRREGTGVVVDGARERWFTPQFRDDERARRILDDLRGLSREGYAACCEAVANFDFRGDLDRIRVPTLVVFGRDDPVTTDEVRADLARFPAVDVAGAHLANVESAEDFNHHLRSAA